MTEIALASMLVLVLMLQLQIRRLHKQVYNLEDQVFERATLRIQAREAAVCNSGSVADESLLEPGAGWSIWPHPDGNSFIVRIRRDGTESTHVCSAEMLMKHLSETEYHSPMPDWARHILHKGHRVS